MPEGLSTTTMWPSSNTMRKPGGVGSGFGAVWFTATRWPARTRRAGSSVRSSSTNTLPVLHRRRTCSQLGPPGSWRSWRRRAAATVPPSSAAPTTNVWGSAGFAGASPSRGARDPPRVPDLEVTFVSATNEFEHPGQRGVEVLRLGPASLRHVGATAALAADRLRHLADDLAGVELADHA